MPSVFKDSNATANAIIDDSNAERTFDSIDSVTNQVQQSDHQLVQSDQSRHCDQEDNNKENTTDEPPTSFSAPSLPINSFGVDVQSLGDYDNSYLYEIDNLPVNSILAIHKSRPPNVTSGVFKNYSPLIHSEQTQHLDSQQIKSQNTPSMGDMPITGRKNRSNKLVSPDGKTQYACEIPGCGKVFSQVGTLNRHVMSHHRNVKNFFCENCNRGFARKDYLNQHIANAHKEIKNSNDDNKPTKRNYTKCKCPNCSVDGGNKTKGPDGKSLHNCHLPNCGKVYNNAAHLKRHLDSHSGKKNFFCQHCDKGFAREDEFLAHVEMHGPTGDEKRAKCKCPNCNVEGGNTTRGPDGKLQHVCHIPDCARIFDLPANLRKHIVRKHDDKGKQASGDNVAEDQQASKGSS